MFLLFIVIVIVIDLGIVIIVVIIIVISLLLLLLLVAGTLNTGTVISKGDMQKVMNQHQNNQFAQDVPFMGGDEKSEDAKSDGTGIFDPGNVHSQVVFIYLPCADIPYL